MICKLLTPVPGQKFVQFSRQLLCLLDEVDPDALHEALIRLIEDTELRHAMGTAARARAVSGYSWDDYVDRAIGAYKALVG